MSDFNVKQAEKILGFKIKNKILFETAFTHRSYLNEHPKYSNPSNERLEFLGDAILQLLSSDFLYKTYPDEPEGQLTNYRSAIVNTASLAKEAERLGYGKLLLLSKGEEASGGRKRQYILANTFESVLGALYLEKGIEFCREFTAKELFYLVDTIVKEKLYKDPKSMFQELSQENGRETPIYKIIKEWGNDHDKTFKVGVYLENDLFGEGEGTSKQKAEQEAALKGLDKLKAV